MAADDELPISAKELVRFFTPDWYAEKGIADPPVYLVAVPTSITQPRWQRDVAAAGGRREPNNRVRSFLRDAVNALLAGAAHDAALQDLDEIEEIEREQAKMPDYDATPLTPEQIRERLELARRIGELGEWAVKWPPYAEISAQQDFWWDVARRYAAKHFLRGWEGTVVDREKKPVVWRASRDGLVEDAVLESLPRGDMLDVGVKAISLMRVDWERRKN